MSALRKLGDYELLAKIGRGAMGTVFKARQIQMDRIVALKILPAELAKDGQFIARFLREARASAKLNHPHIIAGIDVGDENGTYYYAMEYIDGQSLGAVLKMKGAVSEERAIEIGIAVASALDHAHRNGILHRDVKPDNVLLDRDGVPKLCDLGLARAQEINPEELFLTQDGMAVGSPHYISPEQASGKRELDGRTDLYSLGAMLYHLVTGLTPFEAPTASAIMAKHITENLPHPSDRGASVSPAFVSLMAKLLAKDPAYRYASAGLLVEDLERLRDGKPAKHSNLPLNLSPFLASELKTGRYPRNGQTSGTKFRKVERPARAYPSAAVGPSNGPWIAVGVVGALILVALVAVLGSGSRDKQTTTKTSKTPSKSQSPGKTGLRTETSELGPDSKGGNKAGEQQPPVDPKEVAVASSTNGSDPIQNTDIAVQVPPKPAKSPAAVEAAQKADPKDAQPPNLVASVKPEDPAKKDPAAVSAADLDPSLTEDAGLGPNAKAMLSAVVPHVKRYAFDEAGQALKKAYAAAKEWTPLERLAVGARLQGYEALAELKTKIIAALRETPGKITLLDMRRKAGQPDSKLNGKLAGGDDRFLFIVEQQVEIKFDWQNVSLAEFHALAGLAIPALADSARLGLGVLAFDSQNDGLAREALAPIREQEPLARYLLERADARDQALIAQRKREREEGAGKLYAALTAALGAENPDLKTVFESARKLKNEYGDTELMRDKGAEIEGLLPVADAAQKSGLSLEAGNVALAKNGATVNGADSSANLLDGVTTGYTGMLGFTHSSWPCTWTITLSKVHLLREIRLLLWDGNKRFYRYVLETSHDGENYSTVADRSQGKWRSWQTHTFPMRLVKQIRVKGVFNSDNEGFHIVELEAYGTPPNEKPKAKFPSEPPVAK